MSKRVKISVIVPVYNVQAYLPYALQSLMDQTLEDVEFVCVNDGSTDDSLAILEEFAKKDRRFVVISQKNGGLSAARNTGIKASNGEHIMFLDSDDFLDKHACERVWIEFEEGPTDIVIFGTNIVPNMPVAPDWYWWNLTVYSSRHQGFDPKLFFEVPSSKPFVWRQAFARKFLEKNGVLFDENVRFGEDVIFQFQAFAYAENVSYISDPIYHYRWQRSGSLMATANKNMTGLVYEHINIVSKILEFFKVKDMFDKFGFRLFEWTIEFVGMDIVNETLENNREMASYLCEILASYGIKNYKHQFSSLNKRTYKKLIKIAK